MTCKEVRVHVENHRSCASAVPVQPAELAEHLANCRECAQLCEEQQQLVSSLRLLRESAPQPSASLDLAVLSGFREAQNRAVEAKHRVILRRPVVLRWSAAIAAVLLLSAVIFTRRTGPDQTSQVPPLKLTPAVPSIAVSRPVSKDRGIRLPKHASSKPGSTLPARNVGTVATASPDPAAEFRSLMYCDELSCSGALDVVRVQMPSSFRRLTPDAQGDGLIYADVLVGSDGIARGIRVVQ